MKTQAVQFIVNDIDKRFKGSGFELILWTSHGRLRGVFEGIDPAVGLVRISNGFDSTTYVDVKSIEQVQGVEVRR